MALIDFFTGEDSEEDQRILEETDRRLAALNREQAERMRQRGEQEAAYRFEAETQSNLQRGRVADVQEQVEIAFGEGFNEGAANIQSAVGGTVGAAVSTPFKILPWWLILAGVVIALFWFGPPAAFLRRAA